MPRKPIGKKVRFEIFKRDGFKCHYCGATPIQSVLQVDHIIPVAEGGDNSQDNLITSCQPCNIGKGARSLSDVPVSLKERAKAVAEQEQQIRAYSEVMAARRGRLEDEAWSVADVYIEHFRNDGIRKDYLASIKQFVQRIGVHECLEAMEIATAKCFRSEAAAFRYFCGICWKKIRGDE